MASSIVALEASPVGLATLAFAQEEGDWTGTVKQLLARLEASGERSPGDAWVRSAKGLSDALTRLKPDLRRLAVKVEWLAKTSEGRQIRLQYMVKPQRPSQPSQPSRRAGAL